MAEKDINKVPKAESKDKKSDPFKSLINPGGKQGKMKREI